MSGVRHDTGATGVRVVDGRVHRRTGPWTPAVHELLRHLRAEGIVEAPEVLGFDERGDEVLSYIEGDPTEPLYSEGKLVSLGSFLRRLRKAMATFPDPGSRSWRIPFEAGGALVHGDLAWWNLVYRGDDLIGVIDWDLTALARPLTDLAYAMWTNAALEPDLPLDDVLHRARVLVDAYGATAEERRALVEEVAFVQSRVAYVIAHGWSTRELGFPGIWDEGRRIGGLGRTMAWLDEHRDAVTAALLH